MLCACSRLEGVDGFDFCFRLRIRLCVSGFFRKAIRRIQSYHFMSCSSIKKFLHAHGLTEFIRQNCSFLFPRCVFERAAPRMHSKRLGMFPRHFSTDLSWNRFESHFQQVFWIKSFKVLCLVLFGRFFLEAVHPATWQFCFGCVKVEGCCRWCAGYNGNFDIAVRKKDIWRCNPGVKKSLPSLQSWVEQASKRRLAKEGVSLPPASKKPPAGTHRESFPSQKSPLFCQLFVRRFHL